MNNMLNFIKNLHKKPIEKEAGFILHLGSDLI